MEMLIQKLSEENLKAVEDGLPNLIRHLENLAKFGLPTVVALNRFPTDTEDEIKKVIEVCNSLNVEAVLANIGQKVGKVRLI